MRRVDEMRTQRLLAGARIGLTHLAPPMAAPESALQSVDAYRTELDKRGSQYQQLSQGLAALGAKRAELERIRTQQGVAPVMKTVTREPTPIERNLEAVAKTAQDYQRRLVQAQEGLKEMGLTEEQIKLYD